MGHLINESTCRCCGQPFNPDFRNRHHQRFCRRPECRRASKAESQRTWLQKNQGNFTGHEHTERVQAWRKKKGCRHPASPPAGATTGAVSPGTPGDSDRGNGPEAEILLQDCSALLQDLIVHNPLILGLIAHVFGCVLQDDFAGAISLLVRKASAARRRLRSSAAHQSTDDS